MADPNDDLLDYEDDEQQTIAEATAQPKKDVKGTYVSIHSSGFRDFLLKPEILRAIVDCGFEHPSEGKLVLKCKPTLHALNIIDFSSFSMYLQGAANKPNA